MAHDILVGSGTKRLHDTGNVFERPVVAETTKLRILHVISSVDPRGGGPIEGITQRALYLSERGHRIEVLSLDGPGADWVAAFPLPVHCVGPSVGTYRWTPRLAPWLGRHARAYDHIILHGLWQYHTRASARVLQRLGVEYSVFTHGMLDPWFQHAYPFKHLKKQGYWRAFEGAVLANAKRVFFTSEEERLRARKSFTPYRVNEVVVPYGTKPPPARNAQSIEAFFDVHSALRGKRLLLYLSRIHEKKGCDLLIDAFAAVAHLHPEIHLVLAGPGDDEMIAQLQRQADRLGVGSRITWAGMLQGAAKWAAFHAAEAFVLPSHQENFGIAVAEALGCGLPVLISDKVNIWREIDADAAGLVAPDTADGTLALLQRWLALSAPEQREMAVAALRCFNARYTVAAMAHGLLDALENKARRSSGPWGEKMVSILHVVTSVDPQLGGVAESIRSRGVQLQQMGHTVEVVSLDPPDAPYVPGYPLRLHALGRGYTPWQYHPALRGWLAANCRRFDAVVVDGLWQYHGTATRRALAGTGVPYFVFPHGMLDPWFKRTYPLKHVKKWLFWPWADYRVLRDAKAVVFTCEEERISAKQSFWLYRVIERLASLGTAAPPSNGEALAARFIEAFPSLGAQPFLLFLGRIHPKKGCDLLLHAFATTASMQPGQHLVMAGPGDPAYVAFLKKKARELGIDQRVHWTGMINGDVKWGSLFASQAFVLPSHQENFGIAVVEALACAKPVLISDKVNIWREIVQDSCGLVEADTSFGVAALLKRWLDMLPASRAAMAAQARHAYEQHYTVRATADALLRVVRA